MSDLKEEEEEEEKMTVMIYYDIYYEFTLCWQNPGLQEITRDWKNEVRKSNNICQE